LAASCRAPSTRGRPSLTRTASAASRGAGGGRGRGTPLARATCTCTRRPSLILPSRPAARPRPSGRSLINGRATQCRATASLSRQSRSSGTPSRSSSRCTRRARTRPFTRARRRSCLPFT
jgi:hypothetical protein